jgi:transcriptional regulator with XRE-family HTH domain
MIFEDFQKKRLIDLAEITGIDQTRWSRYLRGKRDMNISTLQKAASSMGIESHTLLEFINLRRIQKTNYELRTNKELRET